MNATGKQVDLCPLSVVLENSCTQGCWVFSQPWKTVTAIQSLSEVLILMKETSVMGEKNKIEMTF